MSRLAPILRRTLVSPTIRRIAVVLLLVVAYQLWLSVQAMGKADPGVGENPNARGRFAVDIVLNFEPERYHALELQKHGRIRSTDGNIVHLRSVSPAGVNALARYYWIDAIHPPKESDRSGTAPRPRPGWAELAAWAIKAVPARPRTRLRAYAEKS